jgi:YHS domain-containing protein
MLRTFLYIVIGLFVIMFLRTVAGVLFRGISEMLQPSQPESAARSANSGAPLGGELKRDPVCGTFVATSTSLKKTLHGETVYFCSPECRDKYAG